MGAPDENSAFTFGSFSKPVKWNAQVLECWSRILLRVPNSHLILHHGIGGRHQNLRDEVLEKFAGLGVAADRVTIAGRLSNAEHFDLYNRLHLVLDTFPYNGTTSTCEALWMGLPSVVLAGDRHAARVGVSLMTQVGLEEFIAATPEEYVDLAVTMSARRETLSLLRQGMRQRLLKSPLCDARGLTHNLETAYRWAWQRWCRERVSVLRS
jgi:predicted O-linked N-acetylglucosamine transferase (SPINDLY family)